MEEDLTAAVAVAIINPEITWLRATIQRLMRVYGEET